MTTHSHSDDFDIAKSIFDKIKDLPSERQQRLLRWIAEGLGLPGVSQASGGASEVDLGVLPRLSAADTQARRVSDIKSFVLEKAPKSDQQFSAVVAYFYRFEASPAERRESINGELLQEAARLSGRKRMPNPRITLNNAKSAGYLDGVSPGEFSINSVGENLVAMTLPGGGDAAVTKRRAAKKKQPAKKKSKR